MSHSLDVILSISRGEDFDDAHPWVPPGIAHLKAWCESKEIHWPASSSKDARGGNNPVMHSVYCWGGSSIRKEEFLDAVAGAPWWFPQNIQVFFADEYRDQRFQMFSLREDRTWETLGSTIEEWYGPIPNSPEWRETNKEKLGSGTHD